MDENAIEKDGSFESTEGWFKGYKGKVLESVPADGRRRLIRVLFTHTPKGTCLRTPILSAKFSQKIAPYEGYLHPYDAHAV